MSFAVDVNILLYATDTESPFHQKARTFLERCFRGESTVYFAWPTLLGYLRIVTHPAILAQPLSPEEAMSNIEALISLPHVRVLSEEEDFWHHYRSVVAESPARGNQVPDAILAAILHQHDISTLYTRDRDFGRFSFLTVTDPTA